MRRNMFGLGAARLLAGAMVFAGVGLGMSEVRADLNNGTFETSEGYTLGDIQGQNGWSYPINGYTTGAVVASPAGTPGFLGARSLLISNAANANFGVSVGILTPPDPNGPTGTAGSKVEYGPQAGDGPTSNVAVGDYFFRTAAADSTVAQAQGIVDGSDFFQTNLASGSDRFGRVGLFQRTGTTYEVLSDPYLALNPPTDSAGGDNLPTLTVASGLSFGKWYEEQISLTMGPITTTLNGDGSTTYTSTDVMDLSIIDPATEALVGSVQSGTWTLAWALPTDPNAGFPITGDSLFAINGLDFVIRTNLGVVPEGVMFIDLPEPASLVLIAAGGLCMVSRRRTKV